MAVVTNSLTRFLTTSWEDRRAAVGNAVLINARQQYSSSYLFAHWTK